MFSARLASLSDNVFGVAMTLLAVDVIPAGLQPASATWAELRALVLPRIAVLALSFAIAALYWHAQQRRLLQWPVERRLTIYGNLLFLITIVLLPVASRFYEHGGSLVAHFIFGGELAAIALGNAALWVAAAGLRQWRRAALPLVLAAWFMVALAVVPLSADVAEAMWFASFLTPVLGRFATVEGLSGA